jgi:hypothetical protein
MRVPLCRLNRMSWRRAGHGSLKLAGESFSRTIGTSFGTGRPVSTLQKASIGAGMLVLATWVYVVRDKRFMINRRQG